MKNKPIGVFDSGLGGLTVVKELIQQLPHEDIFYYGDTARVPYGTKSKKSIIRFSTENAHILIKQKVKMIVVACNSSSSYALPFLEKKFSVPIIGVIAPSAKKAATLTSNNRVGVIATSATIHSHAYTKKIKQYNSSLKIFGQACPLFVPLVEEGWSTKKITLDIARTYLSPLKKLNIDTLILGCTHYPLLKKTIRKIIGKNVILIDSAKEVAKEIRTLLEKTDQKKLSKRKPRYTFLISDRPQEFKKIARNFLPQRKLNIKYYKGNQNV